MSLTILHPQALPAPVTHLQVAAPAAAAAYERQRLSQSLTVVR